MLDRRLCNADEHRVDCGCGDRIQKRAAVGGCSGTPPSWRRWVVWHSPTRTDAYSGGSPRSKPPSVLSSVCHLAFNLPPSLRPLYLSFAFQPWASCAQPPRASWSLS